MAQTVRRPKSLNFAKSAEKCLHHIIQNVDPDYDYVPYVGVTLGEKRPHFVHHRLDWSEVLPYAIYGAILARDLSGSIEGKKIEQKQRELLLRQISPLDSLIYTRKSPWNESYPMCLWEQSRALHALLYWYMDSGDERLMNIMSNMVNTLFKMSIQTGCMRSFSPDIINHIGMGAIALGELIDPLIKYYELSGDSKAYQLGLGLAYYCTDSKTGFFGDDGNILDNQLYRSAISVLSGVLRAGRLANDQDLITRGKQIHDTLSSYVTRYGATPCTEPACSNMELIYSAIHLAELGDLEYYDQIDRYIRNQTSEAQFLDESEWDFNLARNGRILGKDFQWVFGEYPDQLETLPYDYYGDDVISKSIGGFLWTDFSEHRFVPASLMLCCSGHAMRSYHLVVEKMVQPTIQGFDINFHYSYENNLVELISYEPYIGKFVIIPKQSCHKIRIRIPDYWRKSEITVNGENITDKISNGYYIIQNADPNKEYVFKYLLDCYETQESVYVIKDSVINYIKQVRVQWKGNTVVNLLDNQSQNPKRIYKRSHLIDSKVEYEDMIPHVSSKHIYW